MTDMTNTNTTETTPPRRSWLVSTGQLCYFWLMIGFTMGTIILLWPVRWLTEALQRAGATQRTENLYVIGLVLAYVIVSFLIARRIQKYVRGCATRSVRWRVIAAVTACALLTAWAWRNPSMMLASAAGGREIGSLTTGRGAKFEFGSYPDSARLAELKKQGVTTIISLQDPNIPVEREGVEAEKKLVRQLGLKLVSAPMLPWFSENTESLNKIRGIVAEESGHYYVHCGLGRDRVNMVKRVIESMGGRAVAAEGLREALGFEGRENDFHHGSLISLAPGVWLTPYPEKEELYGCFLEGRPGRVVLLLDSTSAPQDSLLRQARKLFTSYGVPFVELPLRDAKRAGAVADSVRRLGSPVTVIAYRTPWHDGRQKGDDIAVAFSNAYAPSSAWRITTGFVTVQRKPHEWTGGKETAC